MEYLNPNEQDDLKQMLYGYLKDKAQRRAGVTSKAEYEGAEDAFAKQMRLSDTGALLGGLSEAGSMAGQIQGKRAESDIIPKVNQNLYNTTQGAYENFRTLRDQEERSNMNDLQIAQYLRGLEEGDRRLDLEESRYKDLEPRRKLELQLMQKKLASEPSSRRRLEEHLIGPGGEPVTLDEAGLPQTLPGYKLRERPQQVGAGQIISGYEKPGFILERRPDGSLVERPLPSGFQPKARPNETGDGRRMSETSTLKFNQAKDALAAAQGVQKSIDEWKGMMGPVEGTLRGINPWDVNAQKFNSDLKRAAQIIGRYMEDGVLVPADIPKYEGMLPKLGDKPEVAQYKLDQIMQSLNEKQQRDARALEEQGYKKPSVSSQGSSQRQKSILKKQYSPSRNQTKLIYSDGTEEVVDGRQ